MIEKGPGFQPMYAYMDAAVSQACEAFRKKEIPVGAVLVRDAEIIFAAHNECEARKDPLAHAEMLTLRHALCSGIELEDCLLFTTLEPCPMCAGAIACTRLSQVVFGAYDIAEGACGSAYAILTPPKFDIYGGIREMECSALLSEFFKNMRREKKAGQTFGQIE